MKRQIRKFALATVTAALATFGVASQATLVDATTNNPLGFSWSYNTGSSTLTGIGTMTISGFNSTTLSVLISLTNTSSMTGQGGERLTSFGFGIDPNASSVGFSDAADGGMINAVLGANFPAVQGIDVCAIGGSTCAGGSNGGIWAGTTDVFTVTLGGTWGSSVNIDPIGIKYQTGYGSFEFTTGSSSSTSSSSGGTSGQIPEPASSALAGLGLGLLGLGFYRRRKAAAA
jgi:hypothetical protein